MKILLLAYYFPPLGGAGVQRALKFAKYLPEHGITPVVIAADEPGYVTDASLLAELPQEIEVHRIRHSPLLARAARLAGALRGGQRPADAAVSATRGATTAAASSKWRDRLLGVYATLQFPDDKSGWGRRASALVEQSLQRGDIDLILSTSPPVTTHFVAAKLKRRYGVPWLADFRDLWTGNPAYNAPTWRRWLDRRDERRLLAQADGVTGVTEDMAAQLGHDLAAGRQAIFLPNGYDEADFAGGTAARRSDGRFVLLYAGTLYGHQSPQSILAGARHLLQRQPELASRLRLRFIGSIGSRFEPLFTAFESDFPAVVERLAYLPHAEIPASLMAADALLLLIGGGGSARGVLTGKLFEYLRACRPVLLLGPPDGEAARILEGSGHGVAVEEDDVEGAAEIMAKWLAGEVPRDASSCDARVTRFERRSLTGQLAAIIRQVRRASGV